MLATFQVPNSHPWPVTTILDTADIISTKGSAGQEWSIRDPLSSKAKETEGYVIL
jgi:hypothetical protein